MGRHRIKMSKETAVIPHILPLFQIEVELLELLTLAEDSTLTPQELSVIDTQISVYMSAEVRKVDGIAGTIRHCLRAAEECARIAAMGSMWEARAKRIKDSAMRAMQAHGVKTLETPTNKLTVCGNGGLQPLEVYDETQVPDTYKTVTVTMSVAEWESVRDVLTEEYKAGLYEVSGQSVRKELDANRPVPGTRLLERGSHLRVK